MPAGERKMPEPIVVPMTTATALQRPSRRGSDDGGLVEEELASRMEAAGFAKVSWRSLSFGVAAIHVAERPMPGRK